MINELLAVVVPLLEEVEQRVLAAAARDPGLRGRLRDLGAALAALGAEPPGVEVVPEPASWPEPPPGPGPEPVAPPAPAAKPPAPAGPAVPVTALAAMLRLGRVEPEAVPRPAAPEPTRGPTPVADAELPVIAARCRLKAEAARRAAERQRPTRSGDGPGVDVGAGDEDLIARANDLPNCYLWMVARNAPVPDDPARYDDLAGCYEAAADAAELLADLAFQVPTDEELSPALHLAAEAQSALRAAVKRTGWTYSDADQTRLFGRVRDEGAARHIYIARFLREEQLADPAGWADLRDRIRQAGAGARGRKERDRQRKKLLSKVRFHARRVQDQPTDDHAADWETIVRSAAELVEGGLPASNVELRELLLPVRDAVPPELPESRPFRLVLRELDRYRELTAGGANGEPAAADDADEPPTPEVRRAAELLGGRAVVLIGGEGRRHAADALRDALGLSEVIWLEGRERSYVNFEPHVARPDVAVVLLAIRWSSHGFSDVKEFCDRYDKPLVHLPAGYGPNQVAYQVVTQVGDRLAGGVA